MSFRGTSGDDSDESFVRSMRAHTGVNKSFVTIVTERMTAPIDPAALAEFTNEQAAHYDAGYIEGYAAGVAATELDYQLHLGVAKQALALPTRASLERARTVDNQPCRTKCRSCSRCIRYEAAWNNARLYGSPDFPGVAAVRSHQEGIERYDQPA